MEKLKSRKFWMSIITALIIICNEGLDFGLPKEAIFSITGVVMTYLVSQGYVDAKA